MSGVPVSENEDIVDKMLHLFNDKQELDPPLTYENIDRIHHVGKPNASHPRQILVKFSRYNARESVYTEKKSYEISALPDVILKQNPELTLLHHMKNEEVQQTKIYLREDLT